MSSHRRSRLAALRSRLTRIRSELDHASHRRFWVRTDKQRGDDGERAVPRSRAPRRTPAPTR